MQQFWEKRHLKMATLDSILGDITYVSRQFKHGYYASLPVAQTTLVLIDLAAVGKI